MTQEQRDRLYELAIKGNWTIEELNELGNLQRMFYAAYYSDVEELCQQRQ